MGTSPQPPIEAWDEMTAIVASIVASIWLAVCTRALPFMSL